MEYKIYFFHRNPNTHFQLKKELRISFLTGQKWGINSQTSYIWGLALQLTHPYEIKNNWEPGVMMGFTYKSWTFPVYAFNPAGNNRNFVLGINWEWKYVKS